MAKDEERRPKDFVRSFTSHPYLYKMWLRNCDENQEILVLNEVEIYFVECHLNNFKKKNYLLNGTTPMYK